MASLSSYRSSIKSIQRGTSNWSRTITISAVNTAKSFVSWNGYEILGTASGTNDEYSRITLTNSTTLTVSAASGGTGGAYNRKYYWEVVEYY